MNAAGCEFLHLVSRFFVDLAGYGLTVYQIVHQEYFVVLAREEDFFDFEDWGFRPSFIQIFATLDDDALTGDFFEIDLDFGRPEEVHGAAILDIVEGV